MPARLMYTLDAYIVYRKNMTGTEYENYGRQYQTFQKIIAVYDTEPDNFPRYHYGALL